MYRREGDKVSTRTKQVSRAKRPVSERRRGTPQPSGNRNSGVDSLILEYHQFAEALVRRLMFEFKLSASEREDLLGSAYLGLVEAAERFNPNLGTSFKVYAFLRIRGSMIDHLRSNSRVSSSMSQRIKAYAAASQLRESTPIYDRDLSIKDKQRFVLNLISDYALIMRLSMQSSEIIYKADPDLSPEEAMDRKMKRAILHDLIEKLPRKERLVIKKYYLEDLRFSEIVGVEPGFTKSWVSRLHKRGLETLKKMVLATNDGLGEEVLASSFKAAQRRVGTMR